MSARERETHKAWEKAWRSTVTDDEKREPIAADVIERAARAMFEDPTVPAEYTWAQMVEEDPSRADIWRSDARRVLVAAIGEEVHLPAQACDLEGCCDEAAKPNELADQLRGILSENTPTRITAIVERAADALEGTLTEPEWEWALRAVGDGEPFSDVYESLENLADCENGTVWQPEELVRRRKAGPWLEVPDV